MAPAPTSQGVAPTAEAPSVLRMGVRLAVPLLLIVVGGNFCGAYGGPGLATSTHILRYVMLGTVLAVLAAQCSALALWASETGRMFWGESVLWAALAALASFTSAWLVLYWTYLPYRC